MADNHDDIWSTTPPDRPGDYWWIDHDAWVPTPHIVHVTDRCGQLVVRSTGDWIPVSEYAGIFPKCRFCPVAPPGAIQAERERIAQNIEERAKQADATNDDRWPERGIDAGDQLRLVAEAVRRGAPA